MWSVPKIWQGGDVWILGGGPSVVQQFGIPEDVVNKVKAKLEPPSLYSPYMEAIHRKHVIGINVAYMIGPWMDMIFFGDTPFFLEHQRPLRAYPGIKVTCAPSADNAPWVKYLGRDGNKPRGITTNPRKVSWNQNSGSAAISVAYNAGARRVFLLGFDMKLDNNSQHWHSLYSAGLNPHQIAKKAAVFERHMKGFPVIAEDAKRLGLEIINVCPDSNIECFPKLTLKEALNYGA